MSAITAVHLAGPITAMTATPLRPSGRGDGELAAAEDLREGGLDAR